MGEHEPFIAAIEAQPNDRITRLVYADWLDERDNPAGEYLRTELRLASLPEGSAEAPDLQAKLRALRPRIDPLWLSRFDQPRVMLANPTPFPVGWWGVGLTGIRDFDATYQFFAYDSLPPLRHPPLRGTFDWLPKPIEEIDLNPRAATDEEAYKLHLNRLIRHLSDNGLTVPLDFLRWMTDRLVWCIPSCTGCSPFRSWDAAPAEGPPGSRVLPFYIDSQGCITWYLYLTPDGFFCVVAGGAHLCNGWHRMARDNPSAPLDIATPPAGAVDLVVVAPSVEAFFYRWWLENTLWNKLVDPQLDFYDPTPITPEEQAYIDFYREHPVGET